MHDATLTNARTLTGDSILGGSELIERGDIPKEQVVIQSTADNVLSHR